MTIKEIEQNTGIPRASIRFYESEGLLSPERTPNGYRSYSQADLDTLLRIKLLRGLHFSLDEIRALISGEQELSLALPAHQADLDREQADLSRLSRLCGQMYADGARYDTLDAARYLSALEDEPSALDADVLPRVKAPWRRFLARWLDTFFCSALWTLFLGAVCKVNLLGRSNAADLFDILIQLILVLLFEPILLSLFGTTPGKWLLGLRVTDPDGKRLSYSDALSRTFYVLAYGLGFQIPILHLIRLYKSHSACTEGKALPWEQDSELTLRDEHTWRVFAYLGGLAAAVVLAVLAFLLPEQPKYQGDITVAQFCENYNYYADYYNLGGRWRLDPEGRWTEADSGYVTVDLMGSDRPPDFIFTESDGLMTGLTFSAVMTGGHTAGTSYPPSCRAEMTLSSLAFLMAQPHTGLFSRDVSDLADRIQDDPYRPFLFFARGIRLCCEVNYTGYEYAGLIMLPPEDGVDGSYRLDFSLDKNWIAQEAAQPK